MQRPGLRYLYGLLLWAVTLPASAHVVRFEVMSDLRGAAAGVPESYHVIRGIVHGELNPNDSHNRILQDLALAPRNAAGNVEYASTFTLYAPVNPLPGAALIYAVVNRGGDQLRREYASGDFYLLSGWQGDIAFGGSRDDGSKVETIQVPTARNADGTPITGPVFARFMDLPAGTTTLRLDRSMTYSGNDLPPAPFDLDSRHAHLFTKQREDIDGTVTGMKELPATDWAWADCEAAPFPGNPDPQRICLRQGANPALLYELHYVAKDPLVLGIGFAAVRDINHFFLTAATDSHGFTNPVLHHVQAAMAVGFSQSGNFLRTFLNLGFNQAEDGHRVFAGMMVDISARQVPLNVRFGVPGGTSMLYELGTDGVNWWSLTPDPIRHHATSSQLARCTASHTCPMIFDLHGSAEFYSLRASMGYVGTSATTDLPLPSNVRRYYVASTSHGGGGGGFALEGRTISNCVLAANPNPEDPTRRALILGLKQWIVDGVQPPASVYPTLKTGTLAPADQVLASFPHVPGQPLPEHVLNPGLIYNLGPAFDANDVTGAPLAEPPSILGVTPSVLPTLDADGNETGGIHTPLQQVPLGTYTGWNPVAHGFRKGGFCNLTGGYIPFKTTKAERLTAHDPRPSLEERYRSHEEYLSQVRAAVQHMVSARLLLQDDADTMIHQAEASDVRR